MCLQSKRDTTTDITKLLKNAEDLIVVINGEVPPSSRQSDSNMLVAIPEEDTPSYDNSLLDEADNGQPQRLQLQQPSSPSSQAAHDKLIARHDTEIPKHKNEKNMNHFVNQTQSSSKFNVMRLIRMAAMIVMTAVLFIAVKIQNENQYIMRRETQEFHQSAREAIRQAEQRRDKRHMRWENEL